MKTLLLIGLLNSVHGGSYVFEVCFTNNAEDHDLKLHEEPKEKAKFCITKVKDCSKPGVVLIMLDPESQDGFYESKHPLNCK